MKDTILMEEMPSKKQTTIYGVCPSCNSLTHYTLIGVQRWPEQVAKRLGVASEQFLWQCNNCKTSVMEDSIIPASA